jgi:DNA-binding MarR family transcriptional regulator
MSNHDQTSDLTITIPAAIASLPGLNLLEWAALAHIAAFPACSNAKLSKLTGLSVRGVEAMLTRFRKCGLVKMAGNGRARRHELTFRVEHRTKCGKDEVEESRNKCGNDASSESHIPCADGTSASRVANLKKALDDFLNRGMYKEARERTELVRAQVEHDDRLSGEGKAKSLEVFTNAANLFFAYQTLQSMVAKPDGLSHEEADAAMERIRQADSARVALFREQVEGGASQESALKMLAATAG